MSLIPNGIGQVLSRQALAQKASAPKTLFVIGLAGTIVSTILACRATMKVGTVLDEFKENIEDVKASGPSINRPDYSDTDRNRELAVTYVKGTVKVVALYAPAVIVGAASIAALTTSHVTLTRRNAALAGGYTALQAAYDAYRDRVRQEIGEEKERDIYQNARTETVTVDGKVKKLRLVDPNKHSIYARFFDEGNPNWQKNPELNKLFVIAQQNYANDLLHARGHIFLNEVYDMLDLERSQAGQFVGWVIGPEGDNYVDFNIFETDNARFVNGIERTILLDFNVDGVIYNKI